MRPKLKPLSLPKEYAIQKHILPPIRGGIPTKPYPRWIRLILESKLPVGLIPREECITTTRKLSESLYRSFPQQDFDLSDPYMRYRPFNVYNPLSDPHCARYFSRPDIHNNLHRKGFITDDDRVIVSLTEFNQYRKYLYRLQLNEIKEYRRREYENMLYERAVRERHRINEFLRSEEYTAIQNRRSRCVDLCRLIREIDEQERRRYLHYYTADVERKAEWKLEQLRKSVQDNRLLGIERRLLDMKEINEGISRRKEILLKEWMKKIREYQERREDIEVIAEIERKRKARARAKRLRLYQERTVPLEDEARQYYETLRKEGAEHRKILVNIRRKKAYEEFCKLRKSNDWRDVPIERTNFDRSSFKLGREPRSLGIEFEFPTPASSNFRLVRYKRTLEEIEKTESSRKLDFDESKIVLDSENAIDEEAEDAEEEFFRSRSAALNSIDSTGGTENLEQGSTSLLETSSSGVPAEVPISTELSHKIPHKEEEVGRTIVVARKAEEIPSEVIATENMIIEMEKIIPKEDVPIETATSEVETTQQTGEAKTEEEIAHIMKTEMGIMQGESLLVEECRTTTATSTESTQPSIEEEIPPAKKMVIEETETEEKTPQVENILVGEYKPREITSKEEEPSQKLEMLPETSVEAEVQVLPETATPTIELTLEAEEKSARETETDEEIITPTEKKSTEAIATKEIMNDRTVPTAGEKITTDINATDMVETNAIISGKVTKDDVTSMEIAIQKKITPEVNEITEDMLMEKMADDMNTSEDIAMVAQPQSVLETSMDELASQEVMFQEEWLSSEDAMPSEELWLPELLITPEEMDSQKQTKLTECETKTVDVIPQETKLTEPARESPLDEATPGKKTIPTQELMHVEKSDSENIKQIDEIHITSAIDSLDLEAGAELILSELTPADVTISKELGSPKDENTPAEERGVTKEDAELLKDHGLSDISLKFPEENVGKLSPVNDTSVETVASSDISESCDQTLQQMIKPVKEADSLDLLISTEELTSTEELLFMEDLATSSEDQTSTERILRVQEISSTEEPPNAGSTKRMDSKGVSESVASDQKPEKHVIFRE